MLSRKLARSHHSPVRITWVLGLLLIAAIAFVFQPVVHYDFVAWDDDLHIYDNPRLQPVTWDHVQSFWRAPYARLYIPLTYTIWAALVWLTQTLTPGPLTGELFHRLNLLLHLGSVLLVYRLGLLMSNRAGPLPDGHLAGAAASGALLFGLHPLQVEAVAWVSGLKDVLCGWWALVALWQYFAYVQAPRSWQRGVHYGLAAGAFGLALLAKPAAVAVPGVAWLLATAIQRQTPAQATRALGGWLIVALAWGLWTKGQQPDDVMQFITPLWARPLIAGDALAFYLEKFMWPAGLGPDYGRTPQVVLTSGWGYITALVPLGLGAGLWGMRRRLWGLVIAAGVFVMGLLPVLGWVPFMFQAYSTVADRYVYLALLGPALGLGWITRRAGRRWAVWVASGLVLGLLGWRSMQQVQVWRDTVTLFTHALHVNPRGFLAHNNLGLALFHQGKIDAAIQHYNRALHIKDDVLEARYNLGDAMAAQGKLDAAVEHYSYALRLRPAWAEAHNNLGTTLIRQGKIDEAVQHYTQAIQIKPEWVVPYNNLGDAMARQGKFDEALSWFSRAAEVGPAFPEAAYNLAGVFRQQGRTTEAITAYREALRRRPGWPQAAAHLAWLLATQDSPSAQDAAEAVALAEHACRASGYRNAIALRTLAAAYHTAGQRVAAVQTARQALTVARDADAHALAAEVTKELQQYEGAWTSHAIP